MTCLEKTPTRIHKGDGRVSRISGYPEEEKYCQAAQTSPYNNLGLFVLVVTQSRVSGEKIEWLLNIPVYT
jgi:hypothetical protein